MQRAHEPPKFARRPGRSAIAASDACVVGRAGHALEAVREIDLRAQNGARAVVKHVSGSGRGQADTPVARSRIKLVSRRAGEWRAYRVRSTGGRTGGLRHDDKPFRLLSSTGALPAKARRNERSKLNAINASVPTQRRRVEGPCRVNVRTLGGKHGPWIVGSGSSPKFAAFSAFGGAAVMSALFVTLKVDFFLMKVRRGTDWLLPCHAQVRGTPSGTPPRGGLFSPSP